MAKSPSYVSGTANKRSILCYLGLHKWKRAGGTSHFSSNVREKEYRCERCGRTKAVYETKE
ncbi:hypothetical protein [Methanohalobium sp.]|uniref:hypothetical protein n=1 Tax=Methanohalobium sp. TaxID=2837493 RepID=UPI0025F61B87|nr:hypothetical protein [Methanohalobium sp.]